MFSTSEKMLGFSIYILDFKKIISKISELISAFKH